MNRIFLFIFVVCVWSSVGVAQDAKQALLTDVVVDSSISFSGTTQLSKPATIKLWGIEPILSDNHLPTALKLEEFINNHPVNCKVKRWVSPQSATAQCIGFGEQDLALALIESGYAMADRRTVQGTVFETIYKNAESSSRRVRGGLWDSALPEEASLESLKKQSSKKFELTQGTAYFVIVALILGPFAGMLIVGGIIYTGFKRLMNLQKYQMAMAQKKDRSMREREKFIVAASLEGEMNTNRAKLDAFIIIYEELLKNLRDPLKDHKYKKGGDIIHEKPSLSRNVYDSNVDKLDVLGNQIVTDLATLYISIEPNPDYKTIEPSAPIEDVIDFVESIIHDAEAMLAPIDNISGALNVIVRDKRSKQQA